MSNGDSHPVVKAAKDQPLAAAAAVFAFLAFAGIGTFTLVPKSRADAFTGTDAVVLEKRLEDKMVSLVAQVRADLTLYKEAQRAENKAWRDLHVEVVHPKTAVALAVINQQLDSILEKLEDLKAQ